jgi:hypothetical protein
MCCYIKQGHCRMGDKCWYSHTGSDSTPCHYGVSCTKGHAELVKAHPGASSAAKPVKKAKSKKTKAAAAAPAAQPQAAPVQQQQQQQQQDGLFFDGRQHQHYQPQQQFQQPQQQQAARPSAPIVPAADVVCPFCENVGCVGTQQFPIFHGAKRVMGVRGHCGFCDVTFALSS